ncbi:MAG TPA: hypothetical protein VGH74_14415, partial [Planctomycetaceae bacterium]
ENEWARQVGKLPHDCAPLENAAGSLFFDNFGDSARGAVDGLGSSVDRSLIRHRRTALAFLSADRRLGRQWR